MILIEGGRVRADGTPADVLRPEILRSVYAVEVEVGNDSTTGRPFIVPRRPVA